MDRQTFDFFELLLEKIQNALHWAESVRHYELITLLTFTTLHLGRCTQGRWSSTARCKASRENFILNAMHFISSLISKIFFRTLFITFRKRYSSDRKEQSSKYQQVGCERGKICEAALSKISKTSSWFLIGDWEQSQVWPAARLWSHSSPTFLHRARACSPARSQTKKGGNND